SLLKLRAAHLVAVHEQTHQLAHEFVFAVHRPSHDGFPALRPEREVHGGGAFHRSLPVHAATHQLTRLALDDGAASRTHVLVSVPTAHRAHPGIRAAIGVLHVWI